MSQNFLDDYTVCLGHRKTAEDHLKIANQHGYTESLTGAPLKFLDGNDTEISQDDEITFFPAVD